MAAPTPITRAAAADSVHTAELTPAIERSGDDRGLPDRTDPRPASAEAGALPQPLPPEEAWHYRRIFALQAAGSWSDADREIAALSDKTLLGTVLAERYLDPRDRSPEGALRDWLAQYAAEPAAPAIRNLALRRRARNADPPGPTPHQSVDAEAACAAAGATASEASSPAATKSRAEALRAEIERIAADNPRRAEALAHSATAKRLLGESDLDAIRTALAQAYLSEGQAGRALSIAVTARGKRWGAIGRWEAALAAWRLGRMHEARERFAALAQAAGPAGPTTPGAAFWAARAELRLGRPQEVNRWLRVAAQQPESFYGLLARRLLGTDGAADFAAEPFTRHDGERVEADAAGRRVLALLQIGEKMLAERELRLLVAHADADLMPSLLALADRADLPDLSFSLADTVSQSDGRQHNHARYPLPSWRPRGGFMVDRALVFAVMRQESQFLPEVRSESGAVGLMQLMPATARSMAARAGLKLGGRASITNPEINLALAQQYILELTRDDRIQDNLLLIAAAYNSGPAPLGRWLARPEYRNDPLLFLESIPSRQTRNFTERVLANYWIYRQRLGQPTADLDTLAQGEWPTYTAQDQPRVQVAEHAEDR